MSTKITVKEDCGNAPKKILLRDFNIAFAQNDTSFIIEQVTDDIHWHILGDKEVEGIDNFEKEVRKMTDVKVSELILNHIITHGLSAAVEGLMKLEDGKNYRFCDVYLFRGFKDSKIKEMTSYVFEV